MTANDPQISINYRQLFKSFLEALPLPAFVIDRALTIHSINQSALHFCENQTLVRHTRLDQVLHSPEIIQLVQRCIQTGSAQRGQYEKGSSGIAWKVSVTPLEHQTRKLKSVERPADQLYHYFSVIIEDMAELRRLERMQHDFLANISHELRTPLSSVRLLTETLEDTIDTNPEKAQEFVEKIETEIQHLTQLVSELLELSRLESGQLPLMIEPIEAEQLVREVMARMWTFAQRYRVKLRTDIQQGKTRVSADSKLITRVLVNLIHNAIKFTPSGGMVVIGTAPQADQQLQRFFVRDTGIGISQEELPRLFERFYKTDRARSKAGFIGSGGGGSGLGLAIARQVVEAHGGRITAESVPDQGSTFTFTLPIAAEAFRSTGS